MCGYPVIRQERLHFMGALLNERPIPSGRRLPPGSARRETKKARRAARGGTESARPRATRFPTCGPTEVGRRPPRTRRARVRVALVPPGPVSRRMGLAKADLSLTADSPSTGLLAAPREGGSLENHAGGRSDRAPPVLASSGIETVLYGPAGPAGRPCRPCLQDAFPPFCPAFRAFLVCLGRSPRAFLRPLVWLGVGWGQLGF